MDTLSGTLSALVCLLALLSPALPALGQPQSKPAPMASLSSET